MMNTWIERPALEARQLFWLAALHRISGMLYYSVDMWSFQCPEFRSCDPVRRVNNSAFTYGFKPATWPTHKLAGGGNGEGSFLYPGEHGPLASLRLVNIADGIEDWSLLSRLEPSSSLTNGTLSRGADLISQVISNATDRCSDVRVLERVRREAALRVMAAKSDDVTARHALAMRSRGAAMAAKQADAHRSAGSLELGHGIHPTRLWRRLRRLGPEGVAHTAGAPPPSGGIVDASKYADPTGATDAAPGLRRAIAELLAGSQPEHPFALWSNVTDLSGRRLELAGGEYLLQSPLAIPGGFGNVEIRGGTLRAGRLFPANESLLSLGDESGARHIESVSLTSMLLHGGGGLLNGALLKVAYGVGISVGPAVYFEGFSGVGVQIDKGAETLIHECWFVGQYGEGLPFYGGRTQKPPDVTLFNSTAIQINGNDHFVSDVVIWQYTKLGVQVNGEGNILSGVHAWGCGAGWCGKQQCFLSSFHKRLTLQRCCL